MLEIGLGYNKQSGKFQKFVAPDEEDPTKQGETVATFDPGLEINIANKACKPMKGVKDIDTPVAKPKDNAWGEPFILLILKLIYFFVLEKIKKVLKKFNKLV